jgi:hypothetical protein
MTMKLSQLAPLVHAALFSEKKRLIIGKKWWRISSLTQGIKESKEKRRFVIVGQFRFITANRRHRLETVSVAARLAPVTQVEYRGVELIGGVVDGKWVGDLKRACILLTSERAKATLASALYSDQR